MRRELRALLLWVVSCAVLNMAQGQDYERGRLIVKFRNDISESHASLVLAQAGVGDMDRVPHLGLHLVQLPPRADERAFANRLKNFPEVNFVEPNWRVHQTSGSNDPYLGNEWHLSKIGALNAWATTAGSSSIIIAMVDSGVDGAHLDLQSRMLPGWNFCGANSDTSDVNGHGTQTAGCAAAAYNNGIGVSGVAGNCMLMPLRVSDSTGSASVFAIANAITYAADHGARIASASFGMLNCSAIDSAAQYLMGKGGLYFMASGNTSTLSNGVDSPWVVTVAATDQNDLHPSFSTYGAWVDVSSPGVNIYTTSRGGGYTWFGGTSAATPVAASVAALALSANPGLSGNQLLQIVTSSVDDLGTAGWDQYFGWGRVNAYKAVLAALSTPAADSTPPSLDLQSPVNGETDSGVRTVFASASDETQLDRVEFWINGVLKATMYSPPFQWNWDTTTVANGANTLKAVARDMAGNATEASRTVNVSNGGDSQAPTVSIAFPANGSLAGSKVNVSVSASDNVGVVKVELWLDGKLAATDTSSPWSFALSTRRWTVGTHTLVAKAYDAAGNCASSAAVSVEK